MAGRLVTIATFDQPAKARLAQNALQAADIRAAVSDESLIAMDWLLSNAVGGVKVQVREEDAERAVSVLEKAFGEDGAGFGPVDVDPAELAAEAAAHPPDEEGEDRSRPADPDEPDLALVASSATREEYARRMVFTAMLGLIFSSFAFYANVLVLLPMLVSAYAIYLFLNAAFGEGKLSGRGRLNLYLGGAMILAGLSWFLIFLRWSRPS